MRVKRGWSTDFGKARYDVEVDETDLLRMLADYGDEDPASTAARMSTQSVMQIMDAEAMAFVHFSLSKHEPAQAEAHLAKVKEFRAERGRLLGTYVPRKPAG